MTQEADTQLFNGLILLSTPLQIEFVTGTKKGTTTNATATTTTTASTAVAGRQQLVPALILVCSQPLQ